MQTAENPVQNAGGSKKQQMNLDLACIGNCSYSALVDKKGQIVWSCFPRLDGDPVFCSLLKRSSTYMNDIGFFDILLSGCDRSEQSYLRNTAVLSTKLYSSDGALEIIDFIPRFTTYDREYRPNMMIRILKPIQGRPRAQIRLRPTFGYGWGTPEKTRGSNHIRYLLSNMTLRLTTNAPISFIVDEVLFEVEEPLFLVLMPDESLKSPISEMADTYLQKTAAYWRDWVRTLKVPYEWQEQVIRACITLKLSNFEETGAIVAAMTTAIPNAPTGGENFDYRYCWLRDALSVVHTLNQVGATSTMEGYLSFLSNIVANFTANQKSAPEQQQSRIQPVYGISLETRLFEREMHRLPGYRGMGPVKLGTKDAEAVQHDVFGSIIMSLSPAFLDNRLHYDGAELLFKKLEILGEHAVKLYNQPDAGPRGQKEKPQIHTFSSVMCWVACDRLAFLSQTLKFNERHLYWKAHANKLKDEIMEKAWNPTMKSFVSTWGGDQVDSYLLMLPLLHFVPATHERYQSTLTTIESTLRVKDYILFQKGDATALNAATFWYIHVLALAGRVDEARMLFENMLKTLNSSGMLSETVDPETKELWGNFPQNTAMVGLIRCAAVLSKAWHEVY